jgi:hypothetical protein
VRAHATIAIAIIANVTEIAITRKNSVPIGPAKPVGEANVAGVQMPSPYRPNNWAAPCTPIVGSPRTRFSRRRDRYREFSIG